jgi:outer membrane lipoprotein LolB
MWKNNRLLIITYTLAQILMLALGLLLNGCATTTPSSPQLLSWTARSAQLKNISHWSLSGVFSISHNHKTDIAAFDWQQYQQNFFIEIHGPLNLSSMKIVGKPGEVFLYKTFDKAIRATSPEALIEQQTQWIFPISSLVYWIRNLPAPQSRWTTNLVFDQYHHLLTLNQQGWQINYRHFTSVAGIDLPDELELFTIQINRLHQLPEPLKIKMVIKSWSLSPSPLP